MINKKIFREYDIRGVYPSEVNENLAYLIGKAYGTKLLSLGKNKTVLGYDVRLSSPSLEKELLKGLLATGVDVIRLGLVTTPMCYFGANYYKTDSSMMITASHNPKEYNGFKFSYNGIHNAYGDSVREIYDIIEKGEFAKGNGTVVDRSIKDPYVDLIINELNLGKRNIKVVYDCGNGTTAVIADELFSKLPIDSVPLFNTLDGNFPNHHPDPCVYENLLKLRDKVLEEHADLGIAYDGDGDRVGFIDNKGNMIETDKFMIIMWRYLYDKVDNKKGLFDVKCTKALEDELIKLGIEPVEYRTGNSYTREATARGNYPFGGELSGHVYFRDKFPGYDDGLYAGMRFIELLTNTSTESSHLLDGINKYYSTEEIKVPVSDQEKFDIVEKIVNYSKQKGYKTLTIDGCKSKFHDGFALVRASNTGPNITLRFEATSEKRLHEIQNEFTNELNKYI